MSLSDLPLLNAILNSTSTVFLITGYRMIKKKNVPAHRACMIAAVIASSLFLISYLTYHYFAGSRRFPGIGTWRTIYLTILLTHTVLAALVPPMALVTLFRAWKKQFDRHSKIARWTLPIWIYVSVTGVIVYLMLYQIRW